MSDLIFEESRCKEHLEHPGAAIRLLLEPKDKDLGGFTVRRLLPTADLRSVGPFIFFDHLGPAVFAPGQGLDVRPHPHIGLATITTVFEGEILHRDSLGHVQPIRPHQINWMTAGKGIAHSERTPPELRRHGHTLHLLQLWIALPEADEETEPFFTHYGEEALPVLEDGRKSVRILIGEACGARSAVKTHSPTLYLDVKLSKGERFTLPDGVDERAAYLIEGEIAVAGCTVPRHHLAVFDRTAGIEVTAHQDSHFVIVGGTPLGRRTMWWNLVASRKELIEKTKQAWRDGTFPQVPGETEFIPLPE